MTLFTSFEPSEQAVLATLMAEAERAEEQAKCPHLVLAVEEQDYYRMTGKCWACDAVLSPEVAE